MLRVKCGVTKSKEKEMVSSPNLESLIKEPHKYFDQVVITVRSGDGGHGAVLTTPTPKEQTKSRVKKEKDNPWKKSSIKRDFDGSLILPMGGHGGDVVIYADESKDSLLDLHKKPRHSAKRGGNADAMGLLTSRLRDGIVAPALRIPVPVGTGSFCGFIRNYISHEIEKLKIGRGCDFSSLTFASLFNYLVGTVVKRKRGKLLADLALPGDEVVVARGGQGGVRMILYCIFCNIKC